MKRRIQFVSNSSSSSFIGVLEGEVFNNEVYIRAKDLFSVHVISSVRELMEQYSFDTEDEAQDNFPDYYEKIKEGKSLVEIDIPYDICSDMRDDSILMIKSKTSEGKLECSE